LTLLPVLVVGLLDDGTEVEGTLGGMLRMLMIDSFDVFVE
jgi:hypothetical protein